MNKHIGIFLTHPMWEKQFISVLEIAEQHINEGDIVYLYSCHNDFQFCEHILAESIGCSKQYCEIKGDMCVRCKNIKTKGLKLMGHKYVDKQLIFPEFYKNSITINETNLSSLSEFKNIKVESFDVGWAVLSTLIHITRNPFLDLNGNKKALQQLIDISIATYFSALKHIEEDMLDTVFFQNGRLSYTRAIYRACQRSNTDFYTIEAGSSLQKYGLFHNTSLHNIANTTKLIFQYWEENPDIKEKTEIGKSFYINRYNGGSESIKSFVAEQQRNLLPNEWNDRNYNVVAFTSSEDEFASIGPEWDNPLYKSQVDGLKQIANEFYNTKSDTKLYIRVHPNSNEMSEEYKTLLMNISGKNVVVIPPDSKISTYLLMDRADKVITFGSTMGMEATFWGKPSILLNKSMYYYFDCCYRPNSHQEAIKLIFDKNLKAIRNENLLKYGYFFKSHGVLYKYFKASGFQGGTYKGINLRDYSYTWHNIYWWKLKIKKLLNK